MAILKTAPFKKPIIDISGPKGNAFYLLGVAQKYAKQFDWESADIESMLDGIQL